MDTITEFPVAMNLNCKWLDVQVLKWAWDEGLFESPAELERCRLHKINWFAGYLFPEEEPTRLELLMRFFLGLFLLDDLLDLIRDGSMIEFLEELKTGNPTHSDVRLQTLGNTLLILKQAIEKEFTLSYGRDQWRKVWHEYLHALQWEIQIKIDGIIPALDEYRVFRPKTSGIYLALLLLREGKDKQDCNSQYLETFLARYIYLSNDLVSYTKELTIRDSQNEIIILMESMGDMAISLVHKEIKEMRKSILLFSNQVCLNFTSCEDWIGKLLLFAGGCDAWTAETLRYQRYINGSSGRT